MKKIHISTALVVLAAVLLLAGCSWIGETAGRAKAGYHRGYAEGKG